MYDILIKDGLIVDGTGNPWFKADIGIKGSRIYKIGDLSGAKANLIINAQGLIVSPGFIDIHNHSDFSIFINPTADNYILQEVTTVVIGNCGFSAAPLNDMSYEIMRTIAEPELRKVHPS